MDASEEMYVFNLIQDLKKSVLVQRPEVSVKGKICILHRSARSHIQVIRV